MSVPIISIGNSKVIRLSKTIIEKYNFKDNVELILEKDFIVLRPVIAVRKGWGKLFKQMHKNGDDKLLMTDIFEKDNFG